MVKKRRKIVAAAAHHPIAGQVVLTLMWWMLLLFLFWRVDPEVVKNVGFTGSYLPLPILVIVTIGWTMGIMRHSLIKGAVWGLGAGVFALLRVLGIGEWINALLIMVFLLVMEWYWHVADDKISLNE